MTRKYKINTTLVGLNDVHEENYFVWTKENFNGGYINDLYSALLLSDTKNMIAHNLYTQYNRKNLIFILLLKIIRKYLWLIKMISAHIDKRK